MKKNIILTAIVLFVLSLSSAHAQFIEDALRYSRTPAYSTARAGGLGVAYHGVSDDLAAIQFNPAGLSLIPKSEFSVGFGFRKNTTETDFLGNTQSFKSND
ncbi:MAG: hypothetical protein PF588_05105, partial [Candidatus Kapabacteria bacterium]|nr:hypothetical protein [Candidatus Kapabacteria bacterium]